MTNSIIVWFRNDLRLQDQPAYYHACRSNKPIIPVYLFSDQDANSLGSASKVWLHHSLYALQQSLHKHHLRLILRKGEPLSNLSQLLLETGADEVCWNRCYDPQTLKEDKNIETKLNAQGFKTNVFNGSLLVEPWAMKTKQGTPYKVFTPFWKSFSTWFNTHTPLPQDWKATIPERWPNSLSIEQLVLMPKKTGYTPIEETWKMGEEAAYDRLQRFLDHHLEQYEITRNDPSIWGTSRLSPYLHYGEISPRQIWDAVTEKISTLRLETMKTSARFFLREMVWREFGHHLLYHFPDMVCHSMRKEFTRFPWVENQELLKCWQKGKTGYPLVDAGMRELWHTGWMHNRVRMIVGSFLVKDLLIPWQQGERWFWDTLVDADQASNSMNWQWVAGCGVDASPFFRIFNPVTQSEKFDPQGKYLRQWLPEVRELDDKWIHKPWEASSAVLDRAGICLGKNYPWPVVDHRFARQKALEAFESIKKSK